jgi:hypothetical protein
MTTPDPRKAGQREGARRKDAALALLEARRDVWVRRGRRALLIHLLNIGTGTADDVADLLGKRPDTIDPRWLGTVPGALAQAGIIRRVGYDKSCRPSRHASVLTVWQLADRQAASNWLARHPDCPDPEPDDDAGAPCPASPPSPSSPTPCFVQPALF